MIKKPLVLLVGFFIFFALFFFLNSYYSAEAAFTPQINYQGKLSDSAGDPLEGDYNLQFRICDDALCTTEYWNEVRTSTNKVTITGGLFSVMLGEVEPFNNFDFNRQLYFEVSVGGTGVPAWDVLLPRRLIGSVPNAFNSQKIDGLTTSSLAVLDRYNEFTQENLFVATTTFTGNILIGTTTPYNYDLTVVGDSYFDGDLLVNGEMDLIGPLYIGDGTNNDQQLMVVNVDPANYALGQPNWYWSESFIDSGVGGFAFDVPTTTGYLGIFGKESSGFFAASESATGTASIGLLTGSHTNLDDAQFWTISVNSDGDSSLSESFYGVGDWSNNTGVSFQSVNNNGERSFYTRNLGSAIPVLSFYDDYAFMNRLGIGANPSNGNKFEVHGSSVLRNTVPQTNLTYSLGNSFYRWSNLWTETVNIGSSTWSLTASTSDGRLAFLDNPLTGNERFTILTNGKIGIGTSTPEYNLTVAGDSYFAGNVTTTGDLNVLNNFNIGTSDVIKVSSSSLLPGYSSINFENSGYNGGDLNNIVFSMKNSDDTENSFVQIFNPNTKEVSLMVIDSTLMPIATSTFNLGAIRITDGGESRNTAIGNGTFLSNVPSGTTGNSNTAVGWNTLSSNTTGFGNTVMGVYALTSSTVGHYNTAIGNLSLRYLQDPVGSTTPDGSHYNAAFGPAAGLSLQSGYENVFIGPFSGITPDFNNVYFSGNRNIFIGAWTGTTETNISNHLNIGNLLFSNNVGDGSVSGASSGALGVGIIPTSSTYRLQVNGSSSLEGNVVISGTTTISQLIVSGQSEIVGPIYVGDGTNNDQPLITVNVDPTQYTSGQPNWFWSENFAGANIGGFAFAVPTSTAYLGIFGDEEAGLFASSDDSNGFSEVGLAVGDADNYDNNSIWKLRALGASSNIAFTEIYKPVGNGDIILQTVATTGARTFYTYDGVSEDEVFSFDADSMYIRDDVTMDNSLFVSGNIGINTSTPGYRLTVVGTSSMQDIIPETNLTYNLGSSALRWSNLWTETVNIGTSTWSINNGADGRLSFFDQALGLGNERFSILSNGSVGIGTSTPVEKLVVVGDLRVSGVGNKLIFPDGTVMTTAASSSLNVTSSPEDLNFAADNDSDGDGVINFAVGGDPALYINNDGWLGLGTTNPKGRFHIQDGGGDFNDPRFIIHTTASSSSSRLIFLSDPDYDTGYDNRIIFGKQGRDNLTAPRAGFISNIGTSSFYIYQNVEPVSTTPLQAVALAIDGESRYVGIGTTTPQEKLVVNGNTVIIGDGYATSFIETSDLLLKTNIDNLNYGLNEILSLRPVSFDYLSTGRPSFGFIAQEVKEIIPEVVYGKAGGYGLNYSILTALLAKGIQEQQQQIDLLSSNLNLSVNNSVSEDIVDLPVTESDPQFNTLRVVGATDFYGTITVIGEAGFISKVSFEKDVEIKGKLYVSADQAGTVKIPTGETSIEVEFEGEYEVIPKVVASLFGVKAVFYGIEDKATTGFRIVINEPFIEDLEFDWIALAVKDKAEAQEIIEEFEPAIGNDDSSGGSSETQPEEQQTEEEVVTEEVIETESSGESETQPEEQTTEDNSSQEDTTNETVEEAEPEPEALPDTESETPAETETETSTESESTDTPSESETTVDSNNDSVAPSEASVESSEE